jgi:hypothetical protein
MRWFLSRGRIPSAIDITGLPPGTYKLTATADALHQFTELCESNNSTTALLNITSGTVKVMDPGRDSVPC